MAIQNAIWDENLCFDDEGHENDLEETKDKNGNKEKRKTRSKVSPLKLNNIIELVLLWGYLNFICIVVWLAKCIYEALSAHSASRVRFIR